MTWWTVRVDWRTVCATLADGPKLLPEQPVLHLEIRMVCGHTVHSPAPQADSPAPQADSPANLLQWKTPNSTDRNKATQ
jgi:hypothetical protein